MAKRNEHTELIRRRIVQGVTRELVSFRSWLSCTDGNATRVEMLRGERGEEIVAKTVDTLMTELGLGVDEPPTSKNSKVRRASKGKLGMGKKEAAAEA